MSFADLGLSAPILAAVSEQGYETPSPIQAQAIPAVIAGKDVMAAAQTGTGKTAGFTLPLLERLSKGQPTKSNQVRALILTPTRELAAQVGESVSLYSKGLPLRSSVVFGGVKINPQIARLKHGCDILVATPGRLLDLYQQGAVRFNHLEVLVLDEADRMLDMGFIHDIRKILAVLPAKRQNLMFSATFSDEIRKLAKGIVHQPVEVSVAPANSTAQTVKQWISPVDKNRKSALLSHLIKSESWHQVLVFTRTKHGANKLTKVLEKNGISAAAIHGNKSQGARTKALAAFKSGEISTLVATDIAARGLDIDQLPQVVNFELPNVPEDYVHRIGRTGRAGASGQAVSLVSADETKQLNDIERLIQKKLERHTVAGFEPTNDLGSSSPSSSHKPRRSRPQGEHKDGQRSGENARGHKPAGKNRRHTGQASGESRADSRSSGTQDARPTPRNNTPAKKTSAQSKPSSRGKLSVNHSSSGNTSGQSENKPKRSFSANKPTSPWGNR